MKVKAGRWLALDKGFRLNILKVAAYKNNK